MVSFSHLFAIFSSLCLDGKSDQHSCVKVGIIWNKYQILHILVLQTWCFHCWFPDPKLVTQFRFEGLYFVLWSCSCYVHIMYLYFARLWLCCRIFVAGGRIRVLLLFWRLRLLRFDSCYLIKQSFVVFVLKRYTSNIELLNLLHVH